MSQAYKERVGTAPPPSARDLSTSELVQQAAEQLSRLVRDELTLARMEVAEKGGRAGQGAGMLGVAGVVSMYALGVLLIAAVAALALVLPTWLAALVVGVALLVVAGLLALAGRAQLRRATPAVPEHTARNLRDDLDTVTTAVRMRRRP